jgi:4a-hydroxytetrahydrobiopterin dehydratase
MTDHPAAAPEIETLSITGFREAGGTEAWPVLGDGAMTFFRTDSFATSARLVEAISEIDGIEDHRPDLDIRVDGVTVRLVTRNEQFFGMTRLDVDLARRIVAAARDLGLTADPSIVQCVDPIVIGAHDIKAVMPFWAALMGYVTRPDSPDEDLVDPRRRGPGIWFEEIDAPVSERNRMHVAVWVPYDQAEARVQAAIAAGGKVIYDQRAPAWWTLADPEGNEADIATSMTRD